MILHGHDLVSTGHPEDDDPWCRNCGRPACDIRTNRPEDYCPKATTERTTTP